MVHVDDDMVAVKGARPSIASSYMGPRVWVVIKINLPPMTMTTRNSHSIR